MSEKKISIRFSEKEYSMIKEASEKCQISVSEYIRRKICSGEQQENNFPVKAVRSLLLDMQYEVERQKQRTILVQRIEKLMEEIWNELL